MSNYNYKKLQDLDELFDAYVHHWDSISQSSISAMKRLIDANKSIERVRELHKNNNGRCNECVGDVVMEIYPCPTIKALDGEQ
jgi:hypothetical protein